MRVWENPKFLAKILKCLTRQWFGKDINDLFFCPNLFNFGVLLSNLFSDKVVLDRNVFCFLMHHGMLGDNYGTGVIAEVGMGSSNFT